MNDDDMKPMGLNAENVDEFFAILDSIPTTEPDDWDVSELNEMVQLVLADQTRPAAHRAGEAAGIIENRVRARYNVTDVLPIPLEWEHRIPTEADIVIKVDPPIVAMPEVDYVIDEPSTMNYEPEPTHGVEDEAEAIVRDAFHTIDDPEAERKFKEFWETDRDD